MYIYRYYIAIPDTKQRRNIEEFSLETVRMLRPYAMDRDYISYFPNVFALAVL